MVLARGDQVIAAPTAPPPQDDPQHHIERILQHNAPSADPRHASARGAKICEATSAHRFRARSGSLPNPHGQAAVATPHPEAPAGPRRGPLEARGAARVTGFRQSPVVGDLRGPSARPTFTCYRQLRLQ
jgi:hypothetical protein